MDDASLLTLAEREVQRLTDENDHGAAVIMRALADRVRAGECSVATTVEVAASGADPDLITTLRDALHRYG